MGPQPLAASLQGSFSSYFAGKPSPLAEAQGGNDQNESKNKTRHGRNALMVSKAVCLFYDKVGNLFYRSKLALVIAFANVSQSPPPNLSY
jgi:hypothetical protein